MCYFSTVVPALHLSDKAVFSTITPTLLEGLMLSVRQPGIHKCTFLLCGCLHRDFTHNDLWHNSIFQQSALVCHLVQREIVKVKSMFLADTFIITLNSCCKTHNLSSFTAYTPSFILLSTNPHVCISFSSQCCKQHL